MSCQFKAIAKIVDIQSIKRSLFSNQSNSVVSGDEDDPWNWPDEDEPQSTVSDLWVENCFISISPTSELLVIAHHKSMAILTAKWDSMEESEAKTKYLLTWHGDPRRDHSEVITSVLCLPIAAQGRQSANCGADWTCIAVGFSSGAVRFYTETGSLLVSEILHTGRVVDIKCQCFQPIRCSNETQQFEELFVVYPNVVCCIRGFSLCNTLKVSRSQLARVQANCSERVEAPQLDLVKWSLTEQVSVSDMSVIGSQPTGSFNHLATASLRGGFDASYRSSPPHTALVIAAGHKPYVAFHYIIEGTSAPVLSDVAKAVASKLKSAIGQAVPSWLGRSRRNSIPEKPKEKATLENPEPMSCRFGLCDVLRTGTKIVTCPQRKLSAVCDSLGRVVLIDNLSGLAVRMWKGYREAQCAFLPVEESKGGRCALYLAIYAPKKGIIEVWALQQGPKVVTFPASKTGRLMYVNHGLIGVNSLTMKGSNCSHHPCIFVDNSGLINEIVIPFHSILSDKNNSRGRDGHILKQIKRALHSDQDDEVKELCLQLSTNEMRFQALEMVTSSKRVNVDLLQQTICIFTDTLRNEEKDVDDDFREKIKIACGNLQRILDFYNMVHSRQSQPPKYSTVVPDSPSQSFQELAQLLRMSEVELQRLIVFISTAIESSGKNKVTFKQERDSFPAFLNPFLQSYTKSEPLTLASNSPSSVVANIGEVLCQGVLYGTCSINEWKKAAEESNIMPKALLYAATCYWLSKPLGNNLHSEFSLFNELIGTIFSMADSTERDGWWFQIRSLICACENLSNALTAAVIMRGVCLTIEDQLSDKSEKEWEKVTEEACSWSQIISQLEAVAHLHVIIRYKNKESDTNIPSLESPSTEISLSQIILKGPGSVSELMAKWVGSWAIPPDWVLEKESASVTNEEPCTTGSVIDGFAPDIEGSSEAVPTTNKQDLVLHHLGTLREHFPKSLSSGLLIANLAWEYLLTWVKNFDKMEFLETSLACVACIPNPHLRQGICSIMWNVHLRNKFEATVKLIHKVGKVPKERLSRQEINISHENVKVFLKHIVDFFRLFIESARLAEHTERLKIEREALWTQDTQPSLAEVAAAQATANSELLFVINECATALLLLSTFSLHLHRPITNLFDSVGEACIWNDITSQPQLPKLHFEPKLQENRTSFLMKVITAAIEPLSPDYEESALKEAIHWVGLCFSLACDWSLSAEPLRRHQICELYKQNCDRLAEEIVPAVNDKEVLGSQLLNIVGERMKNVLKHSNSDLKQRMANLSPSLTLWIQKCEESKKVSDLKDIGQLSALTVTLLPETSPEHNLATLLTEALQPLAA